MYLKGKRRGERLLPLESVTLVDAQPGIVSVKDGAGREYLRQEAHSDMTFRIAGTLGTQTITREDAEGQIVERLLLEVDASTQIHDQGEQFSELLQILLYTLLIQSSPDWGEAPYVRYEGRIYRFFVRWLRDHVHVLKGMKYFSPDVKDAIDLYRNTQREDGMIWDNVYPRNNRPNYWDVRFTEGNFIRPFTDGSFEFKRIPVEADVEYLFVEGLYYTWKASGDDGWMIDSLDAAIRALEYSVRDAYRWSEKYQLIKRGYTIDTWDFQTEEDSAVLHDAMRVDPQKTHFGIMFGDNTGYIASCTYLALMLEHVGRTEEAARYRERARTMKARLDEVSWNGQYFTHHVPEHPERSRNLGVDEASQVSLSNAYSLNRGLTQEQCTAIIETYQKLRANLPEGSPGEWYTIYPPFAKGFGDHNGIWQYMNAGVTSIVAGELAHGAFEHGYEQYGVDILRRMLELGQRHGGTVYSSYTGSIPQPPERHFTPLDIAPYANIDTSGSPAIQRDNVTAWLGGGENDMRELPVGEQLLAGISFLIPDPASNGRRGCIGLSTKAGYAQQVTIPVARQAASLYFLHATSSVAPGNPAGLITLHYEDGSTYERYVVVGQNVSSWWFPQVSAEQRPKHTELGWLGKNPVCPEVGVVAYGLDNPKPDLAIERLTLSAAREGSFWGVFALSLSDAPVYFPPNPVSFGIPDSWGAAAVVYALIEGLAGVSDSGVGYEQVTLSPRWEAANVAEASATIVYPASKGYIAYTYQHQQEQRTIELTLTGSGTSCLCHILLPSGAAEVQTVHSANGPLAFTVTRLEQSRYVDFAVDLPGLHTLSIQY